MVYEPGGTPTMKGFIYRIFTDVGIIGEYADRNALDVAALPMFVHYLFGKNALERERIYTDVKRGAAPGSPASATRPSTSRCGTSRASSTTRRSTSCWAARRTGCRPTPAPTTATQPAACPARRRSPSSPCSAGRWATRRSRSTAGAGRRSRQESPTSTRSASGSGDRMDLMLDPACEYITFGDALEGRPGVRRGEASSGTRTRTATAAPRSSPTASCASSSRRRSS